MPYDLFISYSRRDNERGQVTALKTEIESSFRAFAGRDLRVFINTLEIQRQSFNLRPWHDAGEQALQQAHVRQTLEQLHASVRERLDRAERSRSSPNNLIKHNPAFVGCVRVLTELRQALNENR